MVDKILLHVYDCVAETLETEVFLSIGGDSPLLPMNWWSSVIGTANNWLFGMLVLFRKDFKRTCIPSFKWHILFCTQRLEMEQCLCPPLCVFSWLESAKTLSRIQVSGCTGRKDWKCKCRCCILQWLKNSRIRKGRTPQFCSGITQKKAISAGPHRKKCQFVNQACNKAQGRWQWSWNRETQMPQCLAPCIAVKALPFVLPVASADGKGMLLRNIE